MIPRHEAELRNALDPLAYRRHVKLSRRQFRYWIDAKRIRETAWTTLIEHLPKGVKAADLSLIEDEDDILIFYREKMSKLT